MEKDAGIVVGDAGGFGRLSAVSLEIRAAGWDSSIAAGDTGGLGRLSDVFTEIRAAGWDSSIAVSDAGASDGCLNVLFIGDSAR